MFFNLLYLQNLSLPETRGERCQVLLICATPLSRSLTHCQPSKAAFVKGVSIRYWKLAVSRHQINAPDLRKALLQHPSSLAPGTRSGPPTPFSPSPLTGKQPRDDSFSIRGGQACEWLTRPALQAPSPSGHTARLSGGLDSGAPHVLGNSPWPLGGSPDPLPISPREPVGTPTRPPLADCIRSVVIGHPMAQGSLWGGARPGPPQL